MRMSSGMRRAVDGAIRAQRERARQLDETEDSLEADADEPVVIEGTGEADR